mgnify:CR=1 FL=1
MNIILQLTVALFISAMIGAIASKDKDDAEAIAAITFTLSAIVIYLRRNDHKPKKSPPIENAYTWPQLMQYEFNVVGESHYQAAIAKLAEEQEAKYTNAPDAEIEPLTAYLIPDDHNQYDDKAVRVDIDGMQVGHLSREDARSFRRRLSSKKLSGKTTACSALITGGHEKNGERMSYGIVLDIEQFW